MFKDKFVIGIMIAIIIVLIGGVFFVSKNKEVGTDSKFFEVLADDWTKGKRDAPVTLIEYLDLECPSCLVYEPLIKELVKDMPDDLLYVARYFPLTGHKNGLQSALSVEAAGKQNKYWEMHDLLFKEQDVWGQKDATDPTIFEGYAKELGLNLDQFKKDVASEEVRTRVNRDIIGGKSLGVSGTPTFFLNGEKIPNPKSINDFKTLIEAAKLKSVQNQSTGEKVHEHADLALFINGKKVLLQNRPEFFEKDPDIHTHKGTEEIIHKHKTGVTLGQLVDSWETNLPKKVSWYLNGSMQNGDFRKYEFKDLDRIVLSFSDSNFIPSAKQISETTDRACVYSEKCPERGKPPTEECVGGLGTDCD